MKYNIQIKNMHIVDVIMVKIKQIKQIKPIKQLKHLKQIKSPLWRSFALEASIVLLACLVVRYMLVPARWWSVADDLMRCQSQRKQNAFLNLASLICCPHVVATLWMAEIVSYLGSLNLMCFLEPADGKPVQLDIVHILGQLTSALLKGRACFTWARAVRIPRLFATRSWHCGLKQRCSGNYQMSCAVAMLLIIANVQLVWCLFTLRGYVGLVCWTVSLPMPYCRKEKLKTLNMSI